MQPTKPTRLERRIVERVDASLADSSLTPRQRHLVRLALVDELIKARAAARKDGIDAHE